MSIFEALLEDSLYETVVQQEVWLAVRTDGVPGAGTIENPYNCSGAVTDTDPKFDQVMRQLAATYSGSVPVTIRLQPGTFYTRGNSATNGWAPKSKWRIVGAGMGVTTLRLTTTFTASQRIAAIATPHYSNSGLLDGFEVQDLTIDCNATAGSLSAIGGVLVNGRNIWIRNVEVIDFGSKWAGSPTAAIGVAYAFASATFPVENCVVENCVAQKPYNASPLSDVSGFECASNSADLHKGCLFRNNLADFANGSPDLTRSFIGFAVGGGVGTVVDSNIIRGAREGVRQSSMANGDLVVRHNYFAVVLDGVKLDMGSSGSFGRVVCEHNIVDWPDATTGDMASPRGVWLTSAASGSNYGFEQVVIRNNMIRRASTTAGSTATQKGVYVKRGRNVVLENNIIHPGTVVDNGVRFKECATLRPFSNRAVDQTLLRAFNEDTGKPTPELETDIEEAFML